jgi:hypothetical protein
MDAMGNLSGNGRWEIPHLPFFNFVFIFIKLMINVMKNGKWKPRKDVMSDEE